MAGWLDLNDAQIKKWAMGLGDAQAAALLGSVLAPGIEVIKGAVNAAAPFIAPPPGAILSAWIKGRLPRELVAWAMGRAGINIGQVEANQVGVALGNKANEVAQLWSAVMKDMVSYPGLAQTLSAYWRGLYGVEGTKEAKAKLDELGKINAIDSKSWQTVEPSLRPWPGIGELGIGANRGILTPREYEELLRLSTGQREDCRKLHDELRKLPPSIGEIIGILGRTVSTRDHSPLSDLWKGFPEALRKWCAWAGLDFDTNISAPPGAAEGTVRWPLALWANHWKSPGWGMVRESLWRLRADNTEEWTQTGANALPPNLDDAREWLKHEGTPPNVAEQMLAMRFVPVSIRYLKILWQRKLVGSSFASGELQSAGNDPRVVPLIIESWEQEQKEKDAKPKKAQKSKCDAQLVKVIESDIELGLIDYADAEKKLVELGVSIEDYPNCFAAANQRRIHRLKVAILGKVKSLYMSGALDEKGVTDALIADGFTASATAEYLSAWEAELSLELRSIAGESVAKWFRVGLLSKEGALSRLASLGFANADIALLLLSSDASADGLQASAVQALQPGNRVQAAATVRLLKSTEKIRKQAQATLARLTSVATIKKLYLDCRVSRDWAQQRLTDIGQTPENVTLLLADWDAVPKTKAQLAACALPAPANPSAAQQATESTPPVPVQSGPADVFGDQSTQTPQETAAQASDSTTVDNTGTLSDQSQQ
jgi:hypothetical protein